MSLACKSALFAESEAFTGAMYWPNGLMTCICFKMHMHVLQNSQHYNPRLLLGARTLMLVDCQDAVHVADWHVRVNITKIAEQRYQNNERST